MLLDWFGRVKTISGYGDNSILWNGARRLWMCSWRTRHPHAGARTTEVLAAAPPRPAAIPRDGTTHIKMSPLEFMQRLAALVPRPRLHLIRFHGVLAPNAGLREAVKLRGREAIRADVGLK